MKTTLDLPRPLLLRIVARAARMRVPISHYVAESLEMVVPKNLPQTPTTPSRKTKDPHFEAFRDELGL